MPTSGSIGSVHLQIRRHIQEGLVNGVDMDIFRSNVFEKHRIDLRSAVDVELHPRLGYDMLDIAWDILDPAPILDAQCLHGR